MSDTPKVVSIRPGVKIKGAEAPDELQQIEAEVVAVLEALLERAKAGEIIGMAASLTHPGNLSSADYIGILSYGMLGAMDIMKLKILVEFSADDEDDD